MSHTACIKRQIYIHGGSGWKGSTKMSKAISTDECVKCEVGAEVMKVYGLDPLTWGTDCSFADCTNPSSARGLCKTHYNYMVRDQSWKKNVFNTLWR
jgi:hypothetical protein